MTVPVPILTSLIAAGAAFLIAFVGASFNIYTRLGRLESGQETLAAEIRASRERSDIQHAAAMERLTAAEDRALAREAAAEDRALARHNELLAEIRLWRSHGHDADGTIFFRVPE